MGDAVARPQRVGVIRSEDALSVWEQFAVQPQRLAHIPRLAGPVGDAVAHLQRVGVVGPLDALLVREQFAVQPQRSRTSPASPVQWAMWWRVPSVSG